MNWPSSSRLKRWLRVLHAYLTVFAFSLLLFFGFTGFMLNHSDWFSLSDATEDEISGQLPPALCVGPDKLAVVEVLRADYDVSGPLESFDTSELELNLMFRRPGASFEVLIDRETGDLSVHSERSGTLGVLTDLHKGESAGWLAGLLVDAASLSLVLSALSGLLLWATMKIRRRWGVVAVVSGSLGLGLLVWLLLA